MSKKKESIDDNNEVPAPDIVYPTYDWHFRYTEQRNTDNPFEITYCIDLLQELSDGKAILKHGERIDGERYYTFEDQKEFTTQELNVEVEPLSAQKWQTLLKYDADGKSIRVAMIKKANSWTDVTAQFKADTYFHDYVVMEGLESSDKKEKEK